MLKIVSFVLGLFCIVISYEVGAYVLDPSESTVDDPTVLYLFIVFVVFMAIFGAMNKAKYETRPKSYLYEQPGTRVLLLPAIFANNDLTHQVFSAEDRLALIFLFERRGAAYSTYESRDGNVRFIGHIISMGEKFISNSNDLHDYREEVREFEFFAVNPSQEKKDARKVDTVMDKEHVSSHLQHDSTYETSINQRRVIREKTDRTVHGKVEGHAGSIATKPIALSDGPTVSFHAGFSEYFDLLRPNGILIADVGLKIVNGFSVIFSEGEATPLLKEITFSTGEDNQSRITITFAARVSGKIISFGTYQISEIAIAPRGTPLIVLTISIKDKEFGLMALDKATNTNLKITKI